MRYRKNVGDIGENFAADLLTNAGYQVIERNYRTKAGEIDIIAIKNTRGDIGIVQSRIAASQHKFIWSQLLDSQRLFVRKGH